MNIEEAKQKLFDFMVNIDDVDQLRLLNEVLTEMLIDPRKFHNNNDYLKDTYADRIGPQALHVVTVIALLMARVQILSATTLPPQPAKDDDDDDPLGIGELFDRMK